MSRYPRTLGLLGVGLALALLGGSAAAQCPDADGDSLCDANDPCTNTAGITVVDPFVRLRKVSPPGALTSRATRIKFVGRLEVPASPPVDPSSAGLRLVISDGTVVTIDVVLPPGAYDTVTGRGWTTDSTGTVYYYRDPHGAFAGIMRAWVRALTPSGDGLASLKVVLFGQDGTYPLPQSDATATVVFDPPVSSSGQCGDGAPSECRFRNQGDKLLCRAPRLDP